MVVQLADGDATAVAGTDACIDLADVSGPPGQGLVGAPLDVTLRAGMVEGVVLGDLYVRRGDHLR